MAVCITLASIALHLMFVLQAGGLWRDEAGGVALATLPTLGETWHELTHDSFPALHVLLLRLWANLGLGSDFGLRCLGGLIGLSLLGAFWWNARIFGFRTPLIALGLLACNLALVRWGDSVRAYGLGCVLVVLFVGRVWVFIRQPAITSFAIASLLALLCVQCLYQSAFLVAATCLSASLICLRRSRHRTGFLALAIGLPGALSLLPYLRALRDAQQWWIVEKTGFNIRLSWQTLSDAMNTPIFLGPWLWVGLLLLACFYGMAVLEQRVSRREDFSKDLPLFGAFSMIGGLVGFFIFAVNAGLPTQPWYWLLLLSYLAICMESILGWRLARAPRWIFICIAVLGFISFGCTVSQIGRRMTNMPEVVSKITAEAGPQDLVVVYPWYCGVSFQRYYQGSAPWATAPELADHRFHRYDLLKNQLQQSEPMRPLLERIREVLNSGGKVWLVGALPAFEAGAISPPNLPPAPEGPMGWYDEPYNQVWGQQLRYFLQHNARNLELVSLPERRHTRYEEVPLWRSSGYVTGF